MQLYHYTPIQVEGIPGHVPLIHVKWFDERQLCTHVHNALEGFEEPTWLNCDDRQANTCRRQPGTTCVFLHDDPELWRKAKTWQRIHTLDNSGQPYTYFERKP